MPDLDVLIESVESFPTVGWPMVGYYIETKAMSVRDLLEQTKRKYEHDYDEELHYPERRT